MSDMTLVVITRDSRDLLEQCLVCINETSGRDEREIIVWDNASSDDTAAFLGCYTQYDGYTICRSEIYESMEEIVRRVLPKVNTKYVAFIEDFVFPISVGWVSVVTSLLDKEESVDSVCLAAKTDERNYIGWTNSAVSARFRAESFLNIQEDSLESSEHRGITVWRTLARTVDTPSMQLAEQSCYIATGPWWYLPRYEKRWSELRAEGRVVDVDMAEVKAKCHWGQRDKLIGMDDFLVEFDKMPQTKPVTICVITRDRRDFVEKSLASIFATSSDNERDVIVFDSGSTDDTPDFLASVSGYPGLCCVRSEENVGTAFYSALLTRLKTPYLVTLDDDAWPLVKGWLSDFRCVMDTESSLGALLMFSSNDGRYSIDVSDRGLSHLWPHGVDNIPKFWKDSLTDRLKNGLLILYPPHGGGPKAVNGVNYYPFAGCEHPNFSHQSTMWRVDVIRSVEVCQEYGPMTDHGVDWGVWVKGSGYDYGVSIDCPMYHACAAWWHVGRYAECWKNKCEQSPVIYNISSEAMWQRYQHAHELSCWGVPLTSADSVFPRVT